MTKGVRAAGTLAAAPMDTKICTRCGESKPLGEFYISRHGVNQAVYMTRCKTCVRFLNWQARYGADREYLSYVQRQIKWRVKRYAKKFKDQIRRQMIVVEARLSRLKRKGLTPWESRVNSAYSLLRRRAHPIERKETTKQYTMSWTALLNNAHAKLVRPMSCWRERIAANAATNLKKRKRVRQKRSCGVLDSNSNGNAEHVAQSCGLEQQSWITSRLLAKEATTQ